jgi:hypothetical protein
MKSLFLSAFCSLILLLLHSCENEGNSELLVFYYDQTSCSDPWANSYYDSKELKSAVISYLSNQGIRPVDFLFLSTDGIQQICSACSCTTGNRIWIKAPGRFEGRLLELGFLKTP